MIKECPNCGSGFDDTHDLAWLQKTKKMTRCMCRPCMMGYFPPQKYLGPQFYLPQANERPEGPTMALEVESNPSPATAQRVWEQGICSIDSDESLRGRSWEIKSPILFSNSYEDWVDRVFEGYEATLYKRCGNHYWIGTSHLSWSQINALMCYCSSLEPWFASLVPMHRRPAEYKWSGAPMSIQNWRRRFYSSRIDFLSSLYGVAGPLLRKPEGRGSLMRGSKRANDHGDKTYHTGPVNRYWWLNVHGHFRMGAIEIRIHPASITPYVIKNQMKSWMIWINFFSNKRNHVYDPLAPLPNYLKQFWRDTISFSSGVEVQGEAKDMV